ncbi:unnamed protein product, partial [Mesorhabditis belari]|uniref:ZP domain-containing protein n=1 Tax=Mesorhabditis belari TaxID=2138241 RepID=A0AAF3J599_9BILA
MKTLDLITFLSIIVKVIIAEHILHETIVPLNPAKLSTSRFLDVRRSPVKRRNPPVFASPRAICGKNHIGIVLSSPFSGRIFTSHRDDFTECSKLFHGATSARLTLGLNDTKCGVRRTQINSPQSTIVYDLRVIVSFDFSRLTEDDRIFDLKCVHSNQNILSLDAFYDAKDVFSKELLSSNKQSFMLIDEKGCSLDEEILPHPKYDQENQSIWTPSKAFRFSKTHRVHFNCLLQVCSINDIECMKRIPPHCPRTHHKRNLAENLSIEERLLRIHAALNGLNHTTITPIEPLKLESSSLRIVDPNEEFVSSHSLSTKYCLSLMGNWICGYSSYLIRCDEHNFDSS